MPDALEPPPRTRGIEAPALAAAAPRKLCTDCGLSRTADPARCGTACQFIRPDYASSETTVHGRARDPERGDEAFFGPYRRMVQARLEPARAGAQWTGIATRLAEKLLEEGAVDAVLAVGSDPDDRWRPRPVIVTDPAAMAECRGMKMGYAPLLALLEPAAAAGHRRLAVVGIPCQVHALRAIEAELGLERLYVIGTPCSDNTTTENFHHFLRLLDPAPERITYLEFRADFHVELRYDDGGKREIPFLQLPISKLPADFFPLTCRTCVDYTNALADLTVGYMAGRGEQWLVVRNERGEELVERLGDELRVTAPTSAGQRAGAVKGFLVNLERAAGGLPTRSMPNWLRPIVGRLMPKVGPKGLEFARARVEMKALEAVVHLRREAPRKLRHMVPPHVWRLTAAYGVTPTSSETRER
jgi:coenzyme F420 hydrogenase subunit beta